MSASSGMLGTQITHTPDAQYFSWYHGLVAILLLLLLPYLASQSLSGQTPDAQQLPLVTKRRFWEISDLRLKIDFYLNGRRTLEKALEELPGKPFQMIGDTGHVIILPPEYANEIRNSPHLDFSKVVAKFVTADIPGFEGFRSGLNDIPAVLDICKIHLTRELSNTLEPLPQECGLAVHEIFPDARAWEKLVIKEKINLLVARMSARVFLGEELCRNLAWLRIAISHIFTGFIAAFCLRLFPSFLRPLAHWFIPHCRRLRAQVKEARELVRNTIEKRQAERMQDMRQGAEPGEYNDGIAWCEKLTKVYNFDVVDMQLGLSIASVHNTTDLISQVIYDVAAHPGMVERLRQEFVEVLGKGAWSKASLYNLKLLDSVIKESQRLKPISVLAMRREATSTVILNDGTILPKGSILGVSAHSMRDPAIYPEPNKFVGDRFLKMRQQLGSENIAQLVTTGPDHLAWGHGNHACPGRFFAAAEIKIVLVHLLLKYDFRVVKGEEPKVRVFGYALESDPAAKIEIRRRIEEIDLSSIGWKS
ncbi:cytochrome P450 [Macrophomina phaseolina]|uniref:Cytochrome P450 n=1 Tax=Macrophomina phaseolina TaxID=35725 RepID=A0ABQ8GH66_9PEZI|nr:cytochrome P450 [Macrophomina phaseolina]